MPKAEASEKIAVWPIIRRILRTAGSERWLFAGALIAMLVESALAVLYPAYMRSMLDYGMAGQRTLFMASLAPFAIALLGLGPTAGLRTFFATAFSERLLARLRQALADRLAGLPLSALQRRHSGDLMSVVTNDINALRTLTAGDMLSIVGQTTACVLSVAYLASVSWQLTIASLAAVPFMFIISSRVIRPIAGRAAALQQEIAKVTAVAQDGLTGLTVTRAYGLEARMDDRLRQTNDSALAQARRLVRLRALANSLSDLMGITPFLLIFGFGGYLTVTGRMTAGSLIAFTALTNNISNPLASVPRLLSNLSVAAGSATRVFALLDQPIERAGGLSDVPATVGTPAVQLSRVGFGYQANAPVLNDLSLAVRRGETVALVGPSGSGKTTLLRLLFGFVEPTAGSVALLGRDLSDWNLAAARDQLALVAQDSYLFPVSLAENIGYGRKDATQADIERAARLANIHDFIVSLPDGYQTVAGERGARLSGGQRQRIALARAILKDAPILLLDEATSALDTESEALVQEALERFAVGRTTLIVAHRLSTIKNADRVLVINNGGIAEEGTHDELLARGGEYSRLYLKQFGSSEAAVAGGASA